MRSLLAFFLGAALAAGVMVVLSPQIAPLAEKFGLEAVAPVGKSLQEKDAEVALSPVEKHLGEESSVEGEVEKEETPMPGKSFPEARMKMTKLFNGMHMRTEIIPEKGDIASRERQNDAAYQLDVLLKIQIPRALTQIEDFQSVNPDLPLVLPGLRDLLKEGEISRAYHSIYERKVKFTEQRATIFNQLLSRHNFFDCDTILELKAPKTGRRVLLVQSEMDVVTDGSDPDRSMEYDTRARSFQPWTAYAWARKSRQPQSPFIPGREKEIAELKTSLKDPNLSERKTADAQYRIRRLKREIEALTYRSSLVASLDSFIVLPTFMFEGNGPFAPQIGDYAIVVHKNVAYPAVVGDKGPNSKIGEASTLICNTIRPESDGRWRAVSDLEATYLVFPGTAPEKITGAPQKSEIRQRCAELVAEIGGLTAPLFTWPEKEAASTPAPATPSSATDPAS